MSYAIALALAGRGELYRNVLAAIAHDDCMSRFEAYLSPTGAAIFSAGAGGKAGVAPAF
jgi:hypothetical protein